MLSSISNAHRPVRALLLWGTAGLFTANAHALGPDIRIPENSNDVVFIVGNQQPQFLASSNNTDIDVEARLERVKTELESFRKDGNVRRLGFAKSLLLSLSQTQRSFDYFMLSASAAQSLHDFPSALAALKEAEVLQPTSRDIVLQRYQINFVQGKYDEANTACQALLAVSDLYSQSCYWQLRAVGGDKTAFEGLRAALAKGLLSDVGGRLWALGTLADIADRSRREDRLRWWQAAQLLNPEDTYNRIQTCYAAIDEQSYVLAIGLSKGFESQDDLAVCRVLALREAGDVHTDELLSLETELAARFEEARWRGDILHKRAYARYLLDVVDEPDLAYKVAEANWRKQREWSDAVLLERARAAHLQTVSSASVLSE